MKIAAASPVSEMTKGQRALKARGLKSTHYARLAGCLAVGAVVVAAGMGLVNPPDANAQAVAPSPPLKLKSDFLGYAVSISPRAGYTDNINLANDETRALENFQSGQAILSNLVTANAIISHPRFTALFSGDLDFSYLVGDTGFIDPVTGEGSASDNFVLNQQIGASGTATIVDNFLYFDVAGGSSRQLVGDNAAFSANPSAARGDRATVNSYAVGPYIYRQFANESIAEVRYRFSQVLIDDSSSNANVFGGDFLNDSRSQEVLARYVSGNLFDRFNFVATAYGNTTDETGSVVLPEFSFDQGTVSLEAQYALNTKFALSGAVGYDEIDTNGTNNFFDDDELSGVFWRAGFVTEPGRKTRLRLEYGRRFGDDFIQADARYEISRRFIFTAGASQTFQTRALANSNQITQLSRSTIDFAQRLREGGEGSPREIIQLATQLSANSGSGIGAQTVGVGPTNTAFARLGGAFDKTTISLNAIYQNSDFGFREFENVSGSFDVTRTLSRRVSLFGNAIYRFADTGFDVADCITDPSFFGVPTLPGADPTADCTQAAAFSGVTHTVAATAGLNYQITPRTRAFGQYTHTERLSPIDALEYTENSVSAGLIVDF